MDKLLSLYLYLNTEKALKAYVENNAFPVFQQFQKEDWFEVQEETMKG